MKNKLIDWKIVSTIIWLLFTFSLTVWWIILGLRHIPGQKNMILLEGLTLLICVLSGGIILIYLILSERSQKIKMQEFFAAFNHEIKTYLSSLRLKAEGLSEDLNEAPEAKEALGIVNDTVRLEIQLENSLFLSSPNSENLFFQKIDLSAAINSIKNNWSMITFSYPEGISIYADQRATETILKNIVQNAYIHGKATHVSISSTKNQEHYVLTITNDGSIFQGDLEKLGELFYRHMQTSRSGIGLFLVKKLSQAMGGYCQFEVNNEKQLITRIAFKRGDLE